MRASGQIAFGLRAGTVRPGNSRNITIELTEEELDSLKLAGLGLRPEPTFVTLAAGGVQDMGGNGVTAVVNGSAVTVSVLLRDTTRPVMISFELDMDTGVLTLRFSERVRASTLNASVITVQGQRLAGGVTHRLLGGTATDAADRTVVVQLTVSDGNAIKVLVGVADGADSSFVSLVEGVVEDLAGNRATGIASNAAQAAAVFRPDVTAPRVVSASLDMNAGVMRLEFSEPMNLTTLDTSLLGVSSDLSASASVTLRHVVLDMTEVYSTVAVLRVAVSDLDAIKRVTGLCRTAASCSFHLSPLRT